MADVTISGLNSASPSKDTATIPFTDGTTTYKTTPAGIVAAAPGSIIQIVSVSNIADMNVGDTPDYISNLVDGQMKVAAGGGVGSLYVTAVTTRRDIPAGRVQGNSSWTAAGQAGVNVNSLSIVPDINYITPWEHRRRWCLNG